MTTPYEEHEDMYNQNLEWEREQEIQASDGAAAQADIEANQYCPTPYDVGREKVAKCLFGISDRLLTLNHSAKVSEILSLKWEHEGHHYGYELVDYDAELPDNSVWHKDEREFEAYCAGRNELIGKGWVKTLSYRVLREGRKWVL